MSYNHSTHKVQVEHILAAHESMPGNLLPILHAMQDAIGYIPQDTLPDIARGLNLSRAEVHGVISFYHYFRKTPPGRHTIRICRAESCQAMNGKALENYATKRLGIEWHETTSDGDFSLEPVYCLGNCACSPSMTVDHEVYGRVTPDRFDEILAACRGERE